MGADVMHRGRTDRAAGFGMIEVLIAVALYAVALVSLFGLLITSVTAGTIGESSAVAVNLARQRIEGLTVMPIPSLLAQNNIVTTERVPAGQGRPYEVRTSVTDLEPSTGQRAVDIAITVRWSVNGAQTYTRTLRTRVAK